MASVDHNWRDCPHDFKDVGAQDVDLRKPNHFFHDSAGCPGECADDHNHPTK